MPKLENYTSFEGRHWETGSLHNLCDCHDYKNPFTDQPFSEAFFLGVSGGITFGYMTFSYEGHAPHVALLTRNTFDPLDRMFSRLAIPKDVSQTTSAKKAEQYLTQSIEEGDPAMVWADMWSLPYNGLVGDQMYGSYPIVVFGHEDGEVSIADRAQDGWRVSTDELKVARAKIKKDRHKFVTIGSPDPDKIVEAVLAGLRDTITVMTDRPPRGSKKNFGFTGFETWQKNLRQHTGRDSWSKVFPNGSELTSGLVTTLDHYASTGVLDDANRGMYADFLTECATILERPEFEDVAETFRTSSGLWRQLSSIVLPDEIPELVEARSLIESRRVAIREADSSTIEAVTKSLRSVISNEPSLSDDDAFRLRHEIADFVDQIRDVEKAGIEHLMEVVHG